MIVIYNYKHITTSCNLKSACHESVNRFLNTGCNDNELLG